MFNKFKKLLSKLKRKTAGPHEDPTPFMSRRELQRTIKRLRKRIHGVADEWHVRYGQLMQDLLRKQIELSYFESLENKGWCYSGEDWWPAAAKVLAGKLRQQIEMLISMNLSKDKLLKDGRKVISKLNLEENSSPEEEAALMWLRHTAPYSRPVFKSDTYYTMM